MGVTCCNGTCETNWHVKNALAESCLHYSSLHAFSARPKITTKSLHLYTDTARDTVPDAACVNSMIHILSISRIHFPTTFDILPLTLKHKSITAINTITMACPWQSENKTISYCKHTNGLRVTKQMRAF